MAYQLEGSLVEVCSCNVTCPCWVGEDPDGGACDGVMAWHIGQVAAAELVPFQGPTGQPTVIQDTPALPTGAPGLPAYVGKAPTYRVNAPNLGLNLDLQNHSAVQSGFRYVA